MYTASISLIIPDLYDRGTVMISLTPFPQSIALTVEETIKVLQDFAEKKVTLEEFEEAKKPFVSHMHSNLFKNYYWLSQMEYMQVTFCSLLVLFFDFERFPFVVPTLCV